MSKINNGGPAYPQAGFKDDPSNCIRMIRPEAGMTLHTRVAIAVLQGFCSDPHWNFSGPEKMVARTFTYADAFIAEMERREKSE